jgi:hypothetical protein
MGYAKRMWEEEQRRRYHTSDDTVCVECFDDSGIKGFIQDNAEVTFCSICERASPTPNAVAADRLLAYFLETVDEHYEDANGSAPYDSEAENGFAVRTFGLYELIYNTLPDIAPYETLEWLYSKLKDDVVYCEKDWQVMTQGEALVSGWEQFCRAVKHESRFMFFIEDDTEDDGEPYRVRRGEMLTELAEIIRASDLVKTIAVGTRIFRVRDHDADQPLATPAQLGPPPLAFAKTAGRMNAAGIVVLYGSYQKSAALAEATGNKPHLTVAEFETLKELTVVDLTDIPPVPSIFEGGARESLQFLHHFAEDVSEPFSPDKSEHIEYAPTQIVSEYLRQRLQGSQGEPIQGLLYRSAKEEGSTNLALFMRSEEVEGVPQEHWRKWEPILRLMCSNEQMRAVSGDEGITVATAEKATIVVPIL